jgi:hypothetical protein
MDRGRVGEDRGSKETDGCPLTGMGVGLHNFSTFCDAYMRVPSLVLVTVDSAAAATAALQLAIICWMKLSSSSSIIWQTS